MSYNEKPGKFVSFSYWSMCRPSDPLIAPGLLFDACISASKRGGSETRGRQKNFILKWLKAEKERLGGTCVCVCPGRRGLVVFFVFFFPIQQLVSAIATFLKLRYHQLFMVIV